MRYRLLPYRQGSAGARGLAQALGGLVLRLAASAFVPRRGDVIINWGFTGELPRNISAWPILNHPSVIRNASNKLTFFRRMREEGHGNLIPNFWENTREIPADVFPVVCRTVLAGHSGDGIVIAERSDQLVPCSLYVQYVKKQEEYRIHVGRAGEGTSIISVQRKARRTDVENPNWQIRNHANGFIYARGGVNPPRSVIEVAQQALLASGLDFGAVDVIYNARQERAYVLEINTAPGLEGQTVEDYASFFNQG